MYMYIVYLALASIETVCSSSRADHSSQHCDKHTDSIDNKADLKKSSCGIWCVVQSVGVMLRRKYGNNST